MTTAGGGTCVCGDMASAHGPDGGCYFCACSRYEAAPAPPPPPAGGPHVTVCRSCKAPVIWCITPRGKRMPVDAVPVSNGNVVVDLMRSPPLAQVQAGGAQRPNAAGSYTSHFATCPQAARWRDR